nr:PIN domain-containing protein [Thermococcus siculi]
MGSNEDPSNLPVRGEGLNRWNLALQGGKEVSDARWDTVGELVSAYGLLPHDARILATALEYNCDRLATLDDDFKNVDLIEIIP